MSAIYTFKLLKFRQLAPFLLWVLFLCALVHRLAWLGAVPPPQATNDEYYHLWAGMSVVEGESPISWTMLQGLDSPTLGVYKWKNAEYTIRRPAFDHPPVFSLLTGISAKLAGVTPVTANLEGPASVTTLWDVPLGRLRFQSMILFAAAFWLMWGWLRLAIGPVAALIALTMFSLIDVLVVHQRLVVADTLTTPLTLVSFWALERWRRGWMPGSRAAALVMLAVGLAGGAKVVALATVPAVFAWTAIALRGRRAMAPCVWACGGAAISVVIMLTYAFIFGPSEFLATMRAQANRFVDLGCLFDLIRQQPMLHQEYNSLYIVSGWILAFMAMASTTGSHRAVYAALLGYVFGYTFFAQSDVFGWYVMPFAPFLCAAWGTGIRGALRHPDRGTSVVLLLLLAACATTKVFALLPAVTTLVRYGFALVAILALIPWGFKMDKLRRRALRWVLLGLFLIGMLAEVVHLIWAQRLFLSNI